MSAFAVGVILGVLAIPAAGVATVALLLAARAVAGTIARLTADTHPEARAATAAVLFGARRARVWSFGNTAVAFITGLDHDARRDAYDRLKPAARVAARPIAVAHPRRRYTDQEADQ